MSYPQAASRSNTIRAPQGHLNLASNGTFQSQTPPRKPSQQRGNKASASTNHSGKGAGNRNGGNSNGNSSGKEGSSGPTVDPRRYKTRLCRSWETKGFCQYEQVCMFAHGPGELRSIEMNIEDELTTESAVHIFRRRQAEQQGVPYVCPKPMPHAARGAAAAARESASASTNKTSTDGNSSTGSTTPPAPKISNATTCTAVSPRDQKLSANPLALALVDDEPDSFDKEEDSEFPLPKALNQSTSLQKELLAGTSLNSLAEASVTSAMSVTTAGSASSSCFKFYVHDPYCEAGGYFRQVVPVAGDPSGEPELDAFEEEL